MDKFIELVELDSGEVVAVGPFHSRDKGQAFAERIEDLGLATSRGGVRMETHAAIERELKAAQAAKADA